MSFENYCIVTPDIGGIGGAQFYTLRRIKHLKHNNCKVYIITGNTSGFALQNEFEGIEILEVPEIFCNPSLFTRSRVKKTNNQISTFLKNKEIQVIESHALASAIYAEIVASEMKCKHIVYLLNEDKVKFNYGAGYTGFFDFKLNRGELFSISSMSLEIILSRKLDATLNKYINVPYDIKELVNQENDLINQHLPSQNVDFKILTITRLDKAYVRNLIYDLTKISQIFTDKSFFLLIVGDSTDKELVKKIKKIAVNSQNLTIVFAGYVHPIPANIFKSFDLFIGMGTASVSSISQGCATAVIDPRDNKSPGFLGLHTNNFGYAENDTINQSIEELLNSVVLNPSILIPAAQGGEKLFSNSYDSNTVMNQFDKEILNSNNIKKYWSFYFKNHLRNSLEFVFIYVFGIKTYMHSLNRLAYYINK
jgi:hypothetical protein